MTWFMRRSIQVSVDIRAAHAGVLVEQYAAVDDNVGALLCGLWGGGGGGGERPTDSINTPLPTRQPDRWRLAPSC